MFARVCAMVSNLFTCGKYLHDRIISLWWEAWDHKTSFIPPYFFIALHAPSQKREQSCICVLGVSSQESEQSCICVLGVMYLCVRGIHFACFYKFCIEFWDCSNSVVFFCFHFILIEIILNTCTSEMFNNWRRENDVNVDLFMYSYSI